MRSFEAMTDEEKQRIFDKFVASSRGCRVLERLPGEAKGRFLFQGSLDECRTWVQDYSNSEILPDSTLLYLVRPLNKGIYEGYEISEGKLVKGYRKYPRRESRGRFSELGWGEESQDW